MALTAGERELISIGASIALGCELCVDVHITESRKLGVADADIDHALAIALDLREEATRLMRRRGLRALGRRIMGSEPDDLPREAAAVASANRPDQLVSVGTAYALNCDAVLERHVAVALGLGVTEDELGHTVRLARFVRGQADSLCCKRI